VLTWLRSLFSGGTRPDSAPEASRDDLAGPGDADAGSEAATPKPLPASPDAPPAAWAEALGVEEAALAGGDVRLTPEEQFISEAVLDHFQTHRPGPAAFPAISLQIFDLAQDPDVSLDKLARLIEVDAALSAGVLVLANSPVYRGVERTETPRDAIARLGTAEVTRLVTALSTRSLFLPEVKAEFETFKAAWGQLFYRSATVGRTASDLATIRKLPFAAQAFVGGMLHDVGASIALRSLAALTFDGQVTPPSPESAARILHRVHVEVGGEVHREWGLPDHLTTLAVRHHEAHLPAEPALAELHLIRLVSALSLMADQPGLNPDAPVEAVESARALGLGPARVAALRASLVENGQWTRMLFGDEA
jgi:HD-like signal output (HDOD) protein